MRFEYEATICVVLDGCVIYILLVSFICTQWRLKQIFIIMLLKWD